MQSCKLLCVLFCVILIIISIQYTQAQTGYSANQIPDSLAIQHNSDLQPAYRETEAEYRARMENYERFLAGDPTVKEEDYVALTRWSGPEGTHPQTYQEYMTTKAYMPFNVQRVNTYDLSLDTSFGGLIYILVDDAIYTSLQTEIQTFVTDLENEGYVVELYTGTYGTPEELKAFLQAGLPDIKGAIFIGDLPAAWFEEPVYDPSGFVMDYFYMDLDGVWEDLDSDGMYDTLSGNKDAEIWVGRVDATTLLGDTLQLYSNYFYKNHLYRTGQLQLPNRGLMYIDDDWYNSALTWNNDMKLLYNYTDFVRNTDGTNIQDFSNRLTWGYEWIQVGAHSSYGSHRFDSNIVSEIHIYSNDIEAIDPHGLFYNLFACHAAQFTGNNYIAGRYLFADTYGVAVIGTAKTGGMLSYYQFYGPLAEGNNIGDAFKSWFNVVGKNNPAWYYGMVILGDPTLIPNIPNKYPVSEFSINDYDVVSGVLPLSGTAKRGLNLSASFDKYNISAGLWVDPPAWYTNGIILSNDGLLEVDKDTVCQFDATEYADGYVLLNLDTTGSGLETYGKTMVEIDNVHFLPLEQEAFKAGTILDLRGDLLNTGTFTVEYASDTNPNTWLSDGITPANGGVSPIVGSTIATWDTSVITSNDYYTIRVIVNHDGFVSNDTMRVVLDPDYMEGWPKKIDYRIVKSISVGNIDNDKELEILAGQASYYDSGTKQFYAWNPDGTNVNGWPVALSGSSLTAPLLINSNGDPSLEVFMGDINGQLYGFNDDGTNLPGFPVPKIGNLYRLMGADIDNDGDYEIISTDLNNNVSVFNTDGTRDPNWPQQLLDEGIPKPAVGNLDADPELEIVAGSATNETNVWDSDGTLLNPGWSQSFPTYVTGIILADVDHDDQLEIIGIGEQDHQLGGVIHIWELDGTIISTWNHPKFVSAAAVGDTDGDDDLEIVINSWSGVYVYETDGSYLYIDSTTCGCSIQLYTNQNSAAIGDIDGDGDMEILIVGANDVFYAFHHDGKSVTGWPKKIMNSFVPVSDTYSYGSDYSPILEDIDKDGDMEILLGYENYVYAWDLPAAYNSSTLEWPMYQHDTQHTGVYMKLVNYCAGTDVNGDGEVNVLDIVLVVFWQGKYSGQPDWQDYDHLDVNQDSKINFDDVTDVIMGISQGC